MLIRTFLSSLFIIYVLCVTRDDILIYYLFSLILNQIQLLPETHVILSCRSQYFLQIALFRASYGIAAQQSSAFYRFLVLKNSQV